MNPNLKNLANTLRSGEYKQAFGVLSQDGKHCCLGVACELYIKQEDDLVKERREGEECDRYDTEAYCLPEKVATWLNVGTVEGRITFTPKVIEILKANNYMGGYIEGDYSYLSVLNDNGLPFSAIADVIESGAVCELLPKAVEV